MANDKYTAVWVSHTSISDYRECPRAYYLKNVYRHPATGNKIQIISPPLALGQAVHEVVEALSVLPTTERFREPLSLKFDTSWKKITGKRGGFKDKDTEARYRSRGEDMLKRISDNPGPLKNLAVKIKQELPYFWLSDEENIILCGRIDWLEYLPQDDSVHIIDFKTSRNEERPGSLQLPIYFLLAKNCQNRPVKKISYWYLERDNGLTEEPLPDYDLAKAEVLEIAKKIKLARKLDLFKCSHGNGCRACLPLEAVLKGEAEHVGTNSFGQDVYILKKPSRSHEDSIIL